MIKYEGKIEFKSRYCFGDGNYYSFNIFYRRKGTSDPFELRSFVGKTSGTYEAVRFKNDKNLIKDTIFFYLKTKLKDQSFFLELKNSDLTSDNYGSYHIQEKFFSDDIKLNFDLSAIDVRDNTFEIEADKLNIAFCGLPSSGKTTLRQKLLEIGEFQSYKIPESVGRKLNSMNIPINENGNIVTQVGAYSLQLRNLPPERGMISDRSLIDTYAFTIVNNDFNNSEKEIFFEFTKFNIKTLPAYDKLIYLPPVIPYSKLDVETRTEDKNFLVKLEECYEETLEKLDLDSRLFKRIESYGIEERFEELLDFIYGKT